MMSKILQDTLRKELLGPQDLGWLTLALAPHQSMNPPLGVYQSEGSFTAYWATLGRIVVVLVLVQWAPLVFINKPLLHTRSEMTITVPD